MAEIIVFPRSPNAYRGPFTHPEIEGMRGELNLLDGLCSKAQNDLKSIQTGIADQARWLTIRHLEFALQMAKYAYDPELVALIERASEKSQYENAVQ
jgi:hypothetical protein